MGGARKEQFIYMFASGVPKWQLHGHLVTARGVGALGNGRVDGGSSGGDESMPDIGGGRSERTRIARVLHCADSTAPIADSLSTEMSPITTFFFINRPIISRLAL